MYAEPFRSLAAGERWDEYCSLLRGKGLDWWFNMDIPVLAGHLLPVLERHKGLGQHDFSSETGHSARLLFLMEAIKPSMSPDTFERLFPLFVSAGDIRGAAACAGAGVASIWDRGYGFEAFTPWYQRIKDLLNESEDRLDPLARASILGFKGHVEMIGFGDTIMTAGTFVDQRRCAEKAKSSSLQTYYAFMLGYCYLWDGKICEMEILISDTIPLAALPDTSYVARVFFGLIHGLFHVLKWDISKGKGILKKIAEDPAFEMLPPSIRLLSQGILMIPSVYEKNSREVEELSERIRRETVPENNFFHQAFFSLSLGIVALNTGRSYRALLYFVMIILLRNLQIT